MKFKGTKAPWTSKGHVITKSNGEKIKQPRGAEGACMTSMAVNHARFVADAKLIAAAPELLKALQFFIENFEPQKAWMKDEFNKATNAINKALGTT